MKKNNFNNLLSKIYRFLNNKLVKDNSNANTLNHNEDVETIEYKSYDKIDENKSLTKKRNIENKIFKNKTIENLIFFIIILVVTLILVKYIFSGNKKENKNESYEDAKLVSSNEVISNSETENYKESLKNDLINILKKIDGVGDVDVLITYSETSKLVPIYNENSSESKTSEEDASGGSRVVESYDSSKEVITDDSSSPITEKVIMPKIEGAIIICEGANNIDVKNNVISAVEAATGLKVHKIQVFEMKN